MFSPVSPAILDFISKKGNVTTLYDCVDYYGSDVDLKKNSLMKASEDNLIRRVDYFFVNSNALRNLHKIVRRAHLVPQGFSLDVYKKRLRINIVLPKDKPLIGFVGSLDARIDFKIVVSIVRKLKDFNFVFWGPIDAKYFDDNPKLSKDLKMLMDCPNVINGISNREKIPALINQFDIGIIPYNIKRNFCKYCYPMKLFEYFYLGKPVIASPVEELKRFPDLVKICKTSTEWERAINLTLNRSWSRRLILKQRKLAIDNSWETKVKQILGKIET
jgi:glycosyltransferase involved in cell wall biosynthesis